MDLAGIEAAMSNLDEAYRSVAKRPVDIMDPEAMRNLGATIEAEIAALGIGERAEVVLREVVRAYADGTDGERVAIRRLFDRYTSFRWGAHLPREWHTAEDLRAHLILLSARDQGDDARDELLALQALCERASRAGIDRATIHRIVVEVALISSEVDRYGMGSLHDLMLRGWG